MIREIEGFYIDAYQLYSQFKDRNYSFLLESNIDHAGLGRYSFIGWDPFALIKSKGNNITIKLEDKIINQTGNPFDYLEELLVKYKKEYSEEFPFTGGAVGYFGYDLCHHIEVLPKTVVDDVNIPDMHFGFYDGVLIIDHLKEKTFVAAHGIIKDCNEVINEIEQKITNSKYNENENLNGYPVTENTRFSSNLSEDEYNYALDKVHEYIKQGDIYQMNMTQRFEAELKTTPDKLYQILRQINPAPFSSYIPIEEAVIVSSSPERYLRLTGDSIETRPIKGTLPRGKTPEEDEINKIALSNSEKDKAELLMIVDLERNDLGRVAKTGSVKVTELYKIETYETVFHLVSTVIAQLKKECTPIDLVKASFPGGSITGAPKIRAMEIIDELEPTARNLYTGSIGYIGFNGDMDLNIVIRTIVCKDNKAYFQAGGGIVWDSDNKLEYEESFHKARALMKSIEIANNLA